jgi:hypothetical protein
MRADAAVRHVHTSVFMLVRTNAGIGNGSVRGAELLERDLGRFAPVRVSRVEIQTFVEVHASSQSRLVDLEVPPKPDAEEANHRRIAVREHDLAVTLGALTGVQRDASGKKSIVGEHADPSDRSSVHGFDLSELLVVEAVGAVGSVLTLRRSEGDVSDPEGDGGLRDAELRGDVVQDQSLSSERARLFLFAEFASVAHDVMISNVRSVW